MIVRLLAQKGLYAFRIAQHLSEGDPDLTLIVYLSLLIGRG